MKSDNHAFDRSNNETLIEATDLHKNYGPVHAVDGLSLNVKAGEIYGLVGADGAGKTTTLRLIVGALHPDGGQAFVCGHHVQKHPEEARANIGYLSQRFSLYEDLTVLENIRFFAEVRGLKPNEWLPRCMEILEFVDLAAFKDRRAGQLSGGMKQKLGLATALVTSPRVLLLDEPTTGVDPVTRQDFWQLLIKLVANSGTPPHSPPSRSGDTAMPSRSSEMGGRQGGVAVIISTPYMDEATRCNRVGFMNKGRIIAEGTPGQLRAVLNDRIVEVRGAPMPLLKQLAAKLGDVEDVRAFGDRLHLRVKDKMAEPVIKALKKSIPAAGGKLTEARSVPPVLEDVFIALSEQTD